MIRMTPAVLIKSLTDASPTWYPGFDEALFFTIRILRKFGVPSCKIAALPKDNEANKKHTTIGAFGYVS